MLKFILSANCHVLTQEHVFLGHEAFYTALPGFIDN